VLQFTFCCCNTHYFTSSSCHIDAPAVYSSGFRFAFDKNHPTGLGYGEDSSDTASSACVRPVCYLTRFRRSPHVCFFVTVRNIGRANTGAWRCWLSGVTHTCTNIQTHTHTYTRSLAHLGRPTIPGTTSNASDGRPHQHAHTLTCKQQLCGRPG